MIDKYLGQPILNIMMKEFEMKNLKLLFAIIIVNISNIYAEDMKPCEKNKVIYEDCKIEGWTPGDFRINNQGRRFVGKMINVIVKDSSMEGVLFEGPVLRNVQFIASTDGQMNLRNAKFDIPLDNVRFGGRLSKTINMDGAYFGGRNGSTIGTLLMSGITVGDTKITFDKFITHGILIITSSRIKKFEFIEGGYNTNLRILNSNIEDISFENTRRFLNAEFIGSILNLSMDRTQSEDKHIAFIGSTLRNSNIKYKNNITFQDTNLSRATINGKLCAEGSIDECK